MLHNIQRQVSILCVIEAFATDYYGTGHLSTVSTYTVYDDTSWLLIILVAGTALAGDIVNCITNGY